MNCVMNEAIFGPLQLRGELCYNVSKTCDIDNELLNYIKIIDNEVNKKTKIIQLMEDSIFTRVIRLDLEYINPIIGLLTMKISNNSYNITHLSIHKSFRRQGLAKMLLSSLACFLKLDCKLVSIIISKKYMEDAVELFRSLKFNEMTIENSYHMLKPVHFFCKITNCPLSVN
jgi:hypothetical protein